ncbi:hypothetical protein CI109_106436 [Kwoniella shandongensis]|uniref:Exoribonuclease phosphorolytic domain-containing protein n=1 Tax=Kwoniella shandongensis TaxID=1734106 RepID=A0A5M6C2C1_9TREE|nr:uncharacterized protein CI109_002618 [Kwoniella shandongensis]KAA5528861.1 hypothetical protein CI109_002618 [Kwoniella shandongensis]
MSRPGPSRRPDGRKALDLRPVHISIGELDRADGSGRFAFGSTAVLASCSGPIEVRLREELPDRATLEVSHRPLEGIGATPSRALVTTLETIFLPLLSLSQHPRSLFQLVVQSLSASSSSSAFSSSSTNIVDSSSSSAQNTWPAPPPSKSAEEDDYQPSSTLTSNDYSPPTSYTFSSRAASINASTLAFLSTGSIPMKGLAIAVSVADLGEKRGGLVLDPSAEEESRAKSRFGFGWAFGQGLSLKKKEQRGMEVEGQEEEKDMELVWVESEGDFTRKEWVEASHISKGAARQILEQIRTKLGEHIENRQLA